MNNSKINIQYVDTNTLVPYVNNPRNNEMAVDKVAASIAEFGWKQPIVIDSSNVIIAGHTRYLAAKKLGCESVPVVIADDLTEGQIKAYRIADNKVSELAQWDFEKLDIELEELKDMDFEMADFGFFDADDDYLKGIFDEEKQPKAESGGEEETEEPQEEQSECDGYTVLVKFDTEEEATEFMEGLEQDGYYCEMLGADKNVSSTNAK